MSLNHFDEEGADLFKQFCSTYNNYLEYGCGYSTVYAYNRGLNVISVDSSKEWTDKINGKIGIKVLHANLGEIEYLGYPKQVPENTYDYYFSPWDNADFVPEFVLIDGRFRVACFISSLMRAKLGTFILFDDFFNRGQYHKILGLTSPKQYGRMALFQKNRTFNPEVLMEFYEEFKCDAR